MEVVIVRHGIALDIGMQGVSCDADRPLSEDGREKTRLAAEGLAVLGCAPDAVLSSPLARAVETAEIVVQAVCPGTPVVVSDVLLPGGSMVETVDVIAACGAGCVMVVGHMPHLGDLAAWLLSGGSVYMPLKKAAACSLVCEGIPRKGMATLQWFLPPRALRLLAGRG